MRERRFTLLGLAVLATALTMSACGHQILGFGGSRKGFLLVRHTRTEALEIRAGDESLGTANAGTITCFREVPTGSVRIEARAGTELVRARTLTLPPEQPLLWDVDHDQVLSGRIHQSLCDDPESQSER